MKPIVDARNPDLWRGVAPGKIWSAWRAGLDRNVGEVFRNDRPRPVVEVRPESGPQRESDRP